MLLRVGFLLGSLAACSGPLGDPDSANVEPPAAQNRDLSLGSRGGDVRAVTEYLTAFGYFPNDRLAQSYPAWRPLVAQAPSDPALFDEHMAEAVRRLQSNMALPITGVVDAATRELLGRPRCGVPDGLAPTDPAEKFALQGSRWGKSPITWRVLSGDDDVTLTEVQSAVSRALASWAAVTSLSFAPWRSGTPDIEIRFGDIDGPDRGDGSSNVLARTAYPANGGDMTLDRAETWSVAAVTPATATDLETVLLHELGHALGLLHSHAFAAMFPVYFGRHRALELDDKVAISSIYDTFTQVSGVAKDIAIGAKGDVWVVGANAFGDGFQAYRWNGKAWAATDGGGLRVAIDQAGFPWLVGASGAIYVRSTAASVNTGVWSRLPGLARDIGAGGGAVWIIGVNPMQGGYGIFKWNGSGWDGTDGGAVKITVGPDGVPWVINSNNNFFRRTGSDPQSGKWELLPGQSTDLAINQGNYLWSVGPVKSGAANVAVWDEQSTIKGTDIPSRAQWIQGKLVGVGGPNEALAVDPNGQPWLVDNSGAIFKTLR